jgi:hypothetical protein
MDPQKTYNIVVDMEQPLTKTNTTFTVVRDPKRSSSCLSSFFKIEEGAISISLRSLTFVGSFLVGAYLLAILKWECNLYPEEC